MIVNTTSSTLRSRSISPNTKLNEKKNKIAFEFDSMRERSTLWTWIWFGPTPLLPMGKIHFRMLPRNTMAISNNQDDDSTGKILINNNNNIFQSKITLKCVLSHRRPFDYPHQHLYFPNTYIYFYFDEGNLIISEVPFWAEIQLFIIFWTRKLIVHCLSLITIHLNSK